MDEPAAHSLRQHYWRVYGATLKGLMRHHGVDPYHFLNETHKLITLADMVIQMKRLRHMLQTLAQGVKWYSLTRHVVMRYRVLELLGIGDCFELVFSVENTKFHAKPSVRGFQILLKTLKTSPSNCVMLEDNLPALMTAKRLGMHTIWVAKKLQKPNFVDHRINSVLALTHLKL